MWDRLTHLITAKARQVYQVGFGSVLYPLLHHIADVGRLGGIGVDHAFEIRCA